jgi:hypothetical protein
MIGFDFDGVICDVQHIFRGHFFDKFGVVIDTAETQPTYGFSIEDSPDFEPWWWDEIPVAIAKYQHICPPFAGAIYALEAIYTHFTLPYIQIITAREASNAVMQVTRLWCDQNFTFPYQIDFCATSDEKTELIGFFDIKYYIDDRFKTAQELAPKLKISYLMNRKWNERDTPLNSNVERVDTLWQMKNHLAQTACFGGKT